MRDFHRGWGEVQSASRQGICGFFRRGENWFALHGGLGTWTRAKPRRNDRAFEGTSVARRRRTEPEAAMNVRPTILCPIDYSDASAGALRYAAAVAEHFATRLIVLAVEDPLLTAAMDFGTGGLWTREASEHEIEKFVAKTFGAGSPILGMCEYDVAVGKPPVEILRVARERSCDLIVMSSQGLTGTRKLFFGSTTERVLRETGVPVLVTPPVNPGPIHVEDAGRLIGRIVVPVDQSAASLHQTQVARALGEALSVPLVLVHVVEPIRSRLAQRLNLAALKLDRDAAAGDALAELLATLPRRLRTDAVLEHGDPAEQIAKTVRDRHAGLVVMALHAAPGLGPRMGSVTYGVLCLSHTLVLALPPRSAATAARERQASRQVSVGAGPTQPAGL
jgi:nucleotide-binding universal stress UspA family protein